MAVAGLRIEWRAHLSGRPKLGLLAQRHSSTITKCCSAAIRQPGMHAWSGESIARRLCRDEGRAQLPSHTAAIPHSCGAQAEDEKAGRLAIKRPLGHLHAFPGCKRSSFASWQALRGMSKENSSRCRQLFAQSRAYTLKNRANSVRLNFVHEKTVWSLCPRLAVVGMLRGGPWIQLRV